MSKEPSWEESTIYTLEKAIEEVNKKVNALIDGQKLTRVYRVHKKGYGDYEYANSIEEANKVKDGGFIEHLYTNNPDDIYGGFFQVEVF